MIQNILLWIFIFVMNPIPKETVKSLQLEYSTRGTHKILLITPDSIIVSHNDSRYSYKIATSEWKKIKLALAKVNLKTISTLKRPSTKSFSDGAMSAQLRVESTIKKYESTNFDDNKPPLKLIGVIETMKSVLATVNSEITF